MVLQLRRLLDVLFIMYVLRSYHTVFSGYQAFRRGTIS